MKFPAPLGLLASGSVFLSHGSRVSAFLVQDDLYAHAIGLMQASPLLDTHVDLPQVLRSLSRNPLDVIPELETRIPGHVDIPRMREGRLGGAFFTVWAPCPDTLGLDPGKDFLGRTDSLRDALEVLDLIKNMIKQHPDHLKYAYSSADIKTAFENGKIASLIAFASSNGGGGPMRPAYPGNGLSDLGRQLVLELNRLGVMVDLAHTSDATMKEVIAISKAPVVWTHAGARAILDHPRNVPDDILQLIGDGAGKNRGIILSVFYPHFIGPIDTANVSHVADHIEHIAGIVGRNHVGIASDFDGMYTTVKGLEDASKYPNLIVELLDRGWTDGEIKAVMGENLMRVMDEVDATKRQLERELPSSAIYEKRTDLPAPWAGADSVYWPYEVQATVAKLFPKHDEL
ncbi:uncharacterized protein Z520_04790 [Fonsecaea multimorphosa CBS 102226]|uniref:Dipeptidase n=1 Tax=Fonsecaea multimorphosa CBS 102226 TaxID=1442371 RepID=A0A0D2K7R1_9EURO|nr:uncharacterized protein Z520_04790 [Fonsecaea multimorphosa CBS 102226]KIX99214.1 hypothetical protein Z520_04790 [Fonsecaea multimorphosa CBS 102226]